MGEKKNVVEREKWGWRNEKKVKKEEMGKMGEEGGGERKKGGKKRLGMLVCLCV